MGEQNLIKTISVDMVRLKTKARLSDVENYFSRFSACADCEYWLSSSFKSYKHNFVFTYNHLVGGHGTASFWVGVTHNASKFDGNVTDVVIEYNPNKCYFIDVLKDILSTFFLYSSFTVVSSVDVAFDLNINIRNIAPVKCSGNIGSRTFDNGSDDITYYFGKRGSNGSIKIYNKARELGLDDVDLTRYEVTLKPKCPLCSIEFWTCDFTPLCSLKVVDCCQLDFEMNGTDKVLVLACLDNVEYLNLLGKDKKKKIKEYINKVAYILAIDNTLITRCLRNYFNTLV